MKRVTVMLIHLLFVSAVTHAQTSSINLTLQEAIARGLEASHRLAELLAREEAARAVEDQRQAASGPQVSLAGSYTRTNHVEAFGVANAFGEVRVLFPDIPDNFRSRVDLQWPIYTGGRLGALTKAAAGESGATAQDRESARADLKLEIIRAYWAVVTARAAQTVVRQALERTNAHLSDVRLQLGVGLIPPSDVFSAEAQQARQQLLSIETENLVETTSAEFRRLAGLEPDAAFELVDALPATDPRDRAGVSPPTESLVVPSLVPAIAAARAARPERKALQFRIDAAAERVAAVSAGRLPILTAIAGYDFESPNRRIFPIEGGWKPSWDIGVYLRWTLFEGGRTQAETAEAAANRRALEARLREFDSAIDVEVRQRAADLRSAHASIEAARSGVQAAAEARRVLGERFTAGVATNTDVLTAQSALLLAELDLTRAIANAHLAAARLDRALGR